MVQLTTKGHDTFSELYPRFNHWSTDLFADLTTDSTIELSNLLQQVILRPGPDAQQT